MFAGSMANQLGLGCLLSYKVQGEAEVRRAERTLRTIRNTSERTAAAADRMRERMEASLAVYKQQAISGMKLAGVGAAILAGLGFATKKAADFEQGLADINTLLVATGYTEEQARQATARLGNTMIAVGTKVRTPIMEMSKAMYDLISADLSVAEAQGAIAATAKLSVAGIGSMEEATNAMTSTLNSFGKAWGTTLTPVEKAEKIANIYVGTIARLKTTLPNLSSAMAYVAGQAANMGLSLQETATAVGMLQTAGIEGPRAGSSYNAFLRVLKQLLGGQRAFDPMLAGLQLVNKETGQFRDIADIIADIEKKFGLTMGKRLADVGESARKAAALTATFGEEGERAISMLLGQSAALREYSAATAESNNLNAMVAARQAAATSGWAIFKNVMNGVLIAFGNALLPFFNLVIRGLTGILSGFLKLVTAYPIISQMIVWGMLGVGMFLLLAGVTKVATAALAIYKLVMFKAGVAGLLSSGGILAFAASVWATLGPVLAISAAIGGLIYLLGKIAGFDMNLGDIAGSVMPKIEMPQIAGMPLLSPRAGQDMLAVQAQSSPHDVYQDLYGEPKRVADYSSHRTTNNFYIDGTKTPEATAREVEGVQRRQARQGAEGRF